MVIREFGASSVFELTDMPVPDIAPHEVLIEVKASSVNPVDWKVRLGFAPPLCPTFPAVLHEDCAGVIAKVGADVDGLEVGDNVYSFATGLAGKQGALAEYMAADARMVAKMPSNLSFAEAATLPLVGVTAWMALIDRSPITPDSNLLIQGGTGGVGFFAVQLARAKLGENIFATSGTSDKIQLAQTLGAKKAFNYKTDSVSDMVAEATAGDGFDTIFNTVGEPAINNSVLVARFGGTIIDINGAFPTDGPFQVNCLSFLSLFAGYPITHGFDQQRVGDILREMTDLVESGAIKPLVDPEQFGFTEVGAAHDFLQNGSPTGKVSLVPDWPQA
ncbi:MAG: zinc-binding dehydrogenase [Pseudomonadota bacterium]